jgi:hypothetical protein
MQTVEGVAMINVYSQGDPLETAAIVETGNTTQQAFRFSAQRCHGSIRVTPTQRKLPVLVKGSGAAV